MAILKFVPGRIYYTRSICDHEIIHKMTVIDRTPKTLKVAIRDEVKTLRVFDYTDRSGLDTIEQVKPFGTYSMCAIIGADREWAAA